MPVLFVEPGAMRAELSLQQPQMVSDGMGGTVRTWVEIATVFGKIEPLTDAGIVAADQPKAALTHRITLRHRAGVASGMRFARQARLFDIETVHDPDESGRYLVCRVSEEGA